MLIQKYKGGSQRRSKTVKAKFHPNWVGQGGLPYTTFELEDGTFIDLIFETEEEVRQYMSHSQVVWKNWQDEQERDSLKRSMGLSND